MKQKIKKQLRKAQLKSHKKISRHFPMGKLRTTSLGDKSSSDSEK